MTDPASPSSDAAAPKSAKAWAQQTARALKAGHRAALGQAITRVESLRPEHRSFTHALLAEIMPDTGRALRLGITGVPGVGKSTFIDGFGSALTAQGHKVAVLAVDPSSRRTGGSILGDKTRMARLAVDPSAFIRPSPAGEALGGGGRATRESILLCEAAGYDVIIVETVGVGQSETLVADMVDCFLVLMLPNAGDELQGIKKGVIEVADILAVNKSDIDDKATERAVGTYRNALHILTPEFADWGVPVTACSGETGAGLEEVWRLIEQHQAMMQRDGRRQARRARQQVGWFRALIHDGLMQAFRALPEMAGRIQEAESAVREGRLPASTAVDSILQHLRRF
jgi:LAO/AO transport system kinase